MATKMIEFYKTRFEVAAYEAAIRTVIEIDGAGAVPIYSNLTVQSGRAKWTLDTVHEFYAKLREDYQQSTLWVTAGAFTIRVTFYGALNETDVSVVHSDFAAIERVMDVWESAAPSSVYPPVPIAPPRRPSIFIGHGGASQEWRVLDQYLRDHLGYVTRFYEVEPRSGGEIRAILEEMFAASDFALLVMTAEDQQPDGTLRARQNVIHETGLAQGRLGWGNAVVMLEQGSEDYSNLAGIQQIRFEKGQIAAAFGSVAAILKKVVGP